MLDIWETKTLNCGNALVLRAKRSGSALRGLGVDGGGILRYGFELLNNTP